VDHGIIAIINDGAVYCGSGIHEWVTPDQYEIRVGQPPVCILFWAQLVNNVVYNATVTLQNVTAHPDFELWKQIFYPQVDTFTMLQIANSNQNFVVTHVAIQIPGFQRSDWVELQTLNAADINLRVPVVVPFVTAVIALDNGNPVSISWDSGCYACDISLCVAAGAYSFCGDKSIEFGTDCPTCDLKVYLGWFGTDANQKYMTSADSRFSQFRQYSIVSAYQSAAATASAESPSFPSFPIENFTT